MMKALLNIFIFLFLFFGSNVLLFADGSKDMYPPDVKGNRAYLVSGVAQTNGAGGHDRFLNNGVHYVFADEGEVIAVASSAKGLGLGEIILTNPNGVKYRATSSVNGRIQANNGLTTREAELAGPGLGYIPYEEEVGIGEGGVWKVEFFGTGGLDSIPIIAADDNWTQDLNSRCIAAWDISVRKRGSTSWIKGRVFANLLNLYIHQNSISNANGGLYAQNYVLTKDGYVYRVDANGSHPAKFTYFVNSTGILDQNNRPAYKSSNAGYMARVHDPNLPDDGMHITHKMFYSFPDLTMPDEAPLHRIHDSAAKTWLVNSSPVVPQVSNIQFEDIEGTGKSVISKGARIRFDVTVPGSFRIAISSVDSEKYPFTTRYIPVQVTGFQHEFIWDGLDGDKQFLPVGDDYPVNISISAMEGEIHFPYFDMEINPNGILVERMNSDDTPHSFATMYWDDTDVSPGLPSEVFALESGPEGISSNINGHRWGRAADTNRPSGALANGGTGSFSFGNEKAMDTWSFAVYAKEEKTVDITVRFSDLEIVNITSQKDTIEPGDLLTYHVLVRNNGPSDAVNAGFEFRLPQGLNIESAIIEGDCGLEKQQTIQQNRMKSQIDIHNGCDIIYKISARSADVIPDETYGFLEVEAGVVRPPGYTDPDATSNDPNVYSPLSAWEECQGACNNVKYNAEVFLLEYEHERGHLALVKTVEQVNPEYIGFFKAGDVLRYTFTVNNVGPYNGVRVNDIQIHDPMLSNTAIFPVNQSVALGENVRVSREYRITQADIDRKYVENTAVVHGKNPRGFSVKDISGTAVDNNQPTKIILYQKPDLRLKKTVLNKGTGEDGQFTIGDDIIYLFEIKHAGEIAVENMQIIDRMIQAEAIPVAASRILNQSISLQGTYKVTEADILAGRVINSATLEGFDEKFGNSIQDISGLTFEDDLPTETPLARPPQGIADHYEIYQGQESVFDVLINDSLGTSRLDINSIEILESPSLGRVRIENGKIHYQTVDNYVLGMDRFTYRVYDRSRLHSEATVTVNINRTVPVAMEDYTKIFYNYEGILRPLKNDYVLHSQLLPESLEIVDYPRYGHLIYLGEGMLRYVPNDNYTGYDEIYYRVMDKNGNWSEPAKIKIEVAGFFIPNAFTPNGDNKNDKLVIIGLYQFDRVELEVIDRFGRRIYYSSDYKNDWDGRSNLDGRIVEEGTYYVSFKGIKANEKPILRRSTILITKDRLHTY